MTGVLRDSRAELDGLPLPGTPWRVRFAEATRGRAALEVYQGEELLDVLVAGGLAADVLCGARRTADATFVWGCLPPGGGVPEVVLRRGWGRAAVRPEVRAAGAAFWIAVAPGGHGRVELPGRGEWLRVRKAGHRG